MATATMIGAAILSVAFHAAAITAWVITTLPTPGVDSGSIANRVFYIPAPDRAPMATGAGGRVKYVGGADRGSGGSGGSGGPRTVGSNLPMHANLGQPSGNDTASMVADVGSQAPTIDSVYSILDVDTAVVRSASSAAPAYPLKLLEQHVEGSIAARYVVDTTGFADTTTFQVLDATNPEFVAAVRDVLPYMRFTPAKIGGMKVRQLVEQRFGFRIKSDSAVGKRTAANP